MSEPEYPRNALTREMDHLREVNKYLRGEGPRPDGFRTPPAQPAPPPASVPTLTEEERLAAWAAETGQVLDSSGRIIGRVDLTRPAPEAAQEEEEEMFGKKTALPVGNTGHKVEFKRIRGIDLDRGVVLIDDFEYSITEEEKSSVAEFAIRVMMRELQTAIAQLVTTHKINLGGPDAESAADPAGGGETESPAKPVARPDKKGKGKPAPEPPRDDPK